MYTHISTSMSSEEQFKTPMNDNPLVNIALEERTTIRIVDGQLENVTPSSVFELIRDIKDPEHPYTLEQLKVVSKENITVGSIDPDGTTPEAGLPIRYVKVLFKPTIPHCSMAAIIGLCIKVLLRRFTKEYLIQVYIVEGTHVSFKALNKQLDDKDRVLAALENEVLLDIMEECLPSIQ